MYGQIPAKKCIGAILWGRTDRFRDKINTERIPFYRKPIGDRA